MGKGDVKVAIIGDASSVVGAFSKASAASSAFSGVFAGMGMAVGMNMLGMTKSVANFVGDSTGKFMEWGGSVRTIMRETGMDAEGASTLGAVAKASGVDIGDLTKSLKFLDKNLVAGKLDNYAGAMKGMAKQSDELEEAQLKLADAQERVGDLQVMQSQKSKKTYSDHVAMREALEDVTKAQEDLATAQSASDISVEKYGISVRDAKGQLLPMWEILTNSAETFERLGDGPEAAALAMKMFGKDGMSMLPFLQQGKDGLEGLAVAAEKSGLVMNDQALQKWKDAKRESRELAISWEGLQTSAGEALIPALTSVTSWMNDNKPALAAGLTELHDKFTNIFGDDPKANFDKGIEALDVTLEQVKTRTRDDGLTETTGVISKSWWQDLLDQVEKVPEGLGQAEDQIEAELIDPLFGSMQDFQKNALDPIWGTLQTGVPGLLETFGSLFDGFKNSVLDPLWGSFEKLTGLLDTVQGKVNKVVGDWSALKNGTAGLATPAGTSPGVSGNAGGGFAEDGWGWVGEHGPELRYTRGGQTSFYPTGQTPAGVGKQQAGVVEIHNHIKIGDHDLGTIVTRHDLSAA